MLFDIRERRWDPELCELLGVDPARLPEVLPSAGSFGTTTEFGGEIPVAGIAGDQQAALFGQACTRPGMAKNTYGTGSFVLLNAGEQMPRAERGPADHDRLGDRAIGSRTRSRRRSSSPAPRCSGCATGSGIVAEAAETEGMAASLDSNDDVYFVPALTGLGSPHWDPYARGTIVGLTRGTTRAHLARAALEGIAYQTVDAVRAQERAAGEQLSELRADGGAVANRWLMQFQADVLGAPVIVPDDRRDDRARRRLPGRDRRRHLDRGTRSATMWARGGPVRAADGARTSASACSDAGPRRSSRAKGWARPWTE